MSLDRWRRVEEIFGAALDQPGPAREEFVRERCGDERDLCDRVLQLLRHDAEAEGFLEPSAWPASVGEHALGSADGRRPVPIEGTPLLEPRTQVGNARVERLLGSGAFGRVYLAHDSMIDRPVALKVVPAPAHADAAWQEQLLREAQAIGRLDSPHVVTLYRVHPPGEHAAWIFEMEYVEGGTLHDLLARRGTIPAAEVVDIARQLAAGLAEAHRFRIVHGDVKPGNVLLAGNGRVRLADFGLAQALGSTDDARNDLRGTPAYMAPELILGEALTPAADVWSFGVVLYQMIAGALPFPGRSAAELFHRVLHESWHPLPGDCPTELRDIVRHCLAKHAWQRIPDGPELERRLGSAARVVTSAPPGPRPLRTESPIGRDEIATWLRERLDRGGAALRIDGETGIGKSHVARYAREVARARGYLWVEARVTPLAGVLRPTLSALREMMQQPISRPDTGHFRKAVDAARDLLESQGSVRLAERQQSLWALQELLAGLAQQNRVVVTLDDVEHADEADRRVIEHLVRAPASPGLSLLLVGRADADEIEGTERRTVGPLGPEDMLHLLQARSGHRSFDSVVAQRILGFAAGNPQRAIEFLIHLTESGAVAQSETAVDRAAGWEAAELPRGFVDLVRLRIGRLPEGERELLEAASVDGSAFDGEALAAVVDQPLLKVLRLLQRIQRKGLIEATARGYRFASDAYREVIHGELAPALRHSLHAALARHLENRGDEVDPERLGTHWEHSGQFERARPYLLRAACQAERRQELRRSIDLCQRAGLDATTPAAEIARCPDGAISLGLCLTDSGRPDEAVGVFRAVEEGADEETTRLTAAVFRMNAMLPVHGPGAVDPKLMRRALDRLPPGEALGTARYAAGLHAKFEGRLDLARSHLVCARTLFEKLDDPGHLSSALDQLGSLARLAGDLDEAAGLRRQAAHESLKVGRRTNAAVSGVNEVIALFDLGRFEGLEGQLENHVRTLLLEDAGNIAFQARLVQSSIRMARGDMRGAASLARDAAEHFRTTAHQRGLAQALLLLSELEAQRGDLDRATELLEEARPLVAAAGTEWTRATANYVAAAISVWRGNPAAAAEAAEACLAAAESTRVRHEMLLLLAGLSFDGLPRSFFRTLREDVPPATAALLRYARSGTIEITDADAVLRDPPPARRALWLAEAEWLRTRCLGLSNEPEKCRAAADRALAAATHLGHRWLRRRILDSTNN